MYDKTGSAATGGKRLALFVFLLLLAARAGAVPEAATNGPSLSLRYGDAEVQTNSVHDFMYFVPLVSPEPVASIIAPEGDQSVHMTSVKRKTSGSSLTATYEMEVSGKGWQQSVFDLGPTARRHEKKLKKGGAVKRQLQSIDIVGDGCVEVEVQGVLSNDVMLANEVRLRFNPHGRTSPVWIHMCDLRGGDGGVHPTNEMMARVNTLTFRRQAGPPKMEVTVASVKHSGAGTGFWQNFKGALAGAAVNMFIEPLDIDRVGQRAMLDFGQALMLSAPSFTFPLATNVHFRASDAHAPAPDQVDH